MLFFFQAFCRSSIANEILMTIRAAKKTSGDIHLQDAIGSDKEGNSITVMDIISTDENSVIDQVDLREDLRKLNRIIDIVLEDREKTIIKLRYGLYNGKEVTQREIADMLGISRSYVSRIEKKALSKLYNEMK